LPLLLLNDAAKHQTSQRAEKTSELRAFSHLKPVLMKMEMKLNADLVGNGNQRQVTAMEVNFMKLSKY